MLLLCLNYGYHNALVTIHVSPIHRNFSNQRNQISAQLVPSCIARAAVVLPHFLPFPPMNTLRSQLPTECAAVRIHLHCRQQAHKAAEVMRNEECLGISIAQAADSEIVEYLAIATSKQVIVISLSDYQTTLLNDEPFRSLLSGKKPILAAFNLPRLSICLCRHLTYDIRAIDLSTFRSESPSNPCYPSELLYGATMSGFNPVTVDSLERYVERGRS